MANTSEANLLLPHEVSESNPNSKKILVFLHGFPDSIRLWDKYVEKFKNEYICVAVSYPNYHKSLRLKWGLDFPEVLQRLKNTIDKVDSGRNLKKMFVCHDWGAMFTYMFDNKYPGYINDIVSLDIGPGIKRNTLKIIPVLGYQILLMWAFLIGSFIGKIITKSFVFLLCIKLAKYRPVNYDEIDSGICFTYYYIMKRMFSALILRRKNQEMLQGYKRTTPLAYIFGLKKPFQFHTEEFLLELQNDPRCEVHAVKGGHWISEQFPELVQEVITRRAKDL
jgi:pimeloyl-ACP methyl ester carboxylesterase